MSLQGRFRNRVQLPIRITPGGKLGAFSWLFSIYLQCGPLNPNESVVLEQILFMPRVVLEPLCWANPVFSHPRSRVFLKIVLALSSRVLPSGFWLADFLFMLAEKHVFINV